MSAASFLRVGDPELAEEITSRVFLKVVRNHDQLRGPPAPWLWAIVRNELARYFRDRKCSEPLSEELRDDRPIPSEVLEHRQAIENLSAAIDQLSDETQQLIYMKFFLNLSQREMAQATGLTESNVGVRIYRTLQQLRTLLEPKEPISIHRDRS